MVRRLLAVALLSGMGCSSVRLVVVQDDGGKRRVVFTGLVFASAERLAKIPTAGTPYGDGGDAPEEIDLSDGMPRPDNQGDLGSCTAWAIAYAIKSYQEKQEEGWSLANAEGQRDDQHVFSPAFLYNSMRARMDTSDLRDRKDIGIPFDQALEFVREHGIAPWSEMPYSDQDHLSQPSERAVAIARRYRIQGYKQVNRDVLSLKAWLSRKTPILFAAGVDKEFGEAWNRPGYTWASGEDPQSPHAMVLVGFSDQRKAFKLMNSWSTQWGDGGFAWLPYRQIFVIREAYILHDAKNERVDRWENDRRDLEEFLGDQARFHITKVQHGASYPDRPDLGKFMRFDGTVDAPSGIGRTVQVAVYFYLDQGGHKSAALRSRDRTYATVNGLAACGSQVFNVAPEGLRTEWSCWISYDALIIPEDRWIPDSDRVRCPVLAEAALFVEHYQVCTAPVIPFEVSQPRKPRRDDRTPLTEAEANELFQRSYELHNQGAYNEAIAGYYRIYQAMANKSLGYLAAYNIACACALSGQRKEALDWLEAAIRSGYRDYEHLSQDSDLDSLRGESRYRALFGSSDARRPAATIQEVQVEHNVWKEDRYWISIRVRFQVDSFRGGRGWVGAFFSFSDGVKLKDMNRVYASDDGQVSVGKYVTPEYDSTIFDECTLEIPYDELHLRQGMKHEIYFDLWVMGEIDGKWKALHASPTRKFFTVDYTR